MTDKSRIPSAARWLSAIALGAFVVGGSAAFLSRNAPAVVSAAVVQPTTTSTKRVPSYIARIAPIPSGSISAITPLPSTAPAAQAVAATIPAAATEAAEPRGDSFRVITDGLNVRRNASSKSARVGSVRQGEIVTMLAREGGWVLIESNGIQGWVFGKYLQPVDETTVAAID
jgi:uncharacterized protein YgiM (DUF1202 family)